MKSILKNKLIIIISVILLIIIAVPVSVYGYNTSNYNKYYNKGLESIAKENFEEASINFNQAKKYKKDSKDIELKLSEIELLKTSKVTYEKAEKLMSDKDLLQAISIYKQITVDAPKYYSLAQEKIKSASDAYINDLMIKANQAATDKKYEDAIKYLDDILKFQPTYSEASNLKNKFNDEIAKLKKEEEARELAKKQAAEAKPSTPTTTSTNSGITSMTTEFGSIYILDNGKKYGYHFGWYNINGPTVFSFSSGMSGETEDTRSPYVNYTIKFKAADQIATVSGTSEPREEELAIPFDTSKFQRNQDYNCVAEITMIYKGKSFSYNVNFVYKIIEVYHP